MIIYAEKGNKVRQINEADIQTYVSRGYNVVDGSGNILHESIPTDVTVLRTSFVKHTNEIKQLKQEIADLKDQLAKAKTKTAKASKPTSEEADK